jgi:hypothetical protein
VAFDEEIIAKAEFPVAKLVPVYTQQGKRPLGFLKVKIWMAGDFDAPSLPDILTGFLGQMSPRSQLLKANHSRGKRKRA